MENWGTFSFSFFLSERVIRLFSVPYKPKNKVPGLDKLEGPAVPKSALSSLKII